MPLARTCSTIRNTDSSTEPQPATNAADGLGMGEARRDLCIVTGDSWNATAMEGQQKPHPRDPCQPSRQSRGMAFPLALAATFFLAAACPLRSADLDGDGLDDAIEQSLLDRHRPILVFENDERHWPISAETFVRNSRLRWNTHPQRRFEYGWLRDVYSQRQMSANPLLVLNGAGGWPGESSNAADHPSRNEWYLDISDNFRGGVYPQPDGSAHQGMYGHAVPLADGSIQLQFWQLFPHNEAECVSDCGDHEGDWTWLDLYLDGAPPYALRQIVYHHHGDNHCPPTSLPFSGGSVGQNVIPAISLPADGVPICFIEEQAHEWWPWSSGGEECDFDPTGFGFCPNASHHGNGIRYRVPTVENIGERDVPMPGSLSAQLILRFNGRWGGWGSECDDHWFEPPDSPIHQRFPTPRSAPYDATFVNFSYEGVERGTLSQPFKQLFKGVAAVPVGRTIIISPGSSEERLTIDKHCTIMSSGGSVTVGR